MMTSDFDIREELAAIEVWEAQLERAGDYYRKRFLDNDFTSVDVFYRIENEFIPRMTTDVQKVYRPVHFDSVRGGARDFPRAFIYNMPAHLSVSAIRPKLDGIPFVKVTRREKTYFCGDYEFEVAADFLVDFAECVDGVFHVLSPYGQGTFEAYGKRFTFHEWKAEAEATEGYIMLIGGAEYRIKYHPTTEVEVKDGLARGLPIDACDGVWEVTYMEDRWVPIRPRFGYPTHPSPIEYILSVPTVLEYFPRLKHKVQYSSTQTGLVGDTFYVRTEVFVSGCGNRSVTRDPSAFSLERLLQAYGIHDVISSVKVAGGEVCNCGVDTFIVSIPYPRYEEAVRQYEDWKMKDDHHVPCILSCTQISTIVCSAKAIIQTGLSIALVAEGEPIFDIIGGKVERGETFDQAMVRECREELGLNLRFSYMTEMLAWEEGTMYRVALYWAYTKLQSPNSKVVYSLPCELPLNVKPWTSRYIQEFMRMGLHQLYDPVTVLSHTPDHLRDRCVVGASRWADFYGNPYLRVENFFSEDPSFFGKPWSADQLKVYVSRFGMPHLQSNLLFVQLVKNAEVLVNGMLIFRKKAILYDTIPEMGDVPYRRKSL